MFRFRRIRIRDMHNSEKRTGNLGNLKFKNRSNPDRPSIVSESLSATPVNSFRRFVQIH